MIVQQHFTKLQIAHIYSRVIQGCGLIKQFIQGYSVFKGATYSKSLSLYYCTREVSGIPQCGHLETRLWCPHYQTAHISGFQKAYVYWGLWSNVLITNWIIDGSRAWSIQGNTDFTISNCSNMHIHQVYTRYSGIPQYGHLGTSLKCPHYQSAHIWGFENPRQMH